jgi:hypothetical protein
MLLQQALCLKKLYEGQVKGPASQAAALGTNLLGALKCHWNKSEIWYQLNCEMKDNSK